MMSIRTFVIAGTIAVAGALSAGTASAEPAIDLGTSATDSGVTQAYFPGGYYPGYGQSRLCYVPFFRLVRIFGYWQARAIKARCFYRPYYGNYYY